MLAAFALYALLVSLAAGLCALFVDRAAAQLRRATRFVWIAVMLAMGVLPVLFFAAALSPRLLAPRTVMLTVFEVQASGAAAGTDADATNTAPEPPSRCCVAVVDTWSRVTAEVAARTARFDGWFAGLWGALSLGVLSLALRARSGTRRLRRRFERRRVDGIDVLISDEFGPAAVGGRAPTIVLPAWILQLDRSLLTLVLRHEREHLAARDPALLSAGLALLILVPWNPFLWWAWRRLRLAIELDCDARVLRGETTPRVYAQLLLFITQHQARRQAGRPFGAGSRHGLMQLASLELGFNPHARQLQRRISAMTTRHSKRPVLLGTLVTATAVTASLGMAVPAPSVAPLASRAVSVRTLDTALVNISRVGIAAEYRTPAQPLEIVLYADGPARIGLGGDTLRLLIDTVRLSQLPSFTADVTQSDVHVVVRRGARAITIGGTVRGGPALEVSAQGTHLVLLKGGGGIRSVRLGAPADSTGADVSYHVDDRPATAADVQRIPLDSVAQLSNRRLGPNRWEFTLATLATARPLTPSDSARMRSDSVTVYFGSNHVRLYSRNILRNRS